VRARTLFALAIAAAVLGSCEREERAFRPDPVATETQEPVTLSSITPGPAPSERNGGKGRQYEQNAFQLSQGKKLFAWFNCNGCHANGGGGSGPALMDDNWIYGSAIENIVASIREGRPNGMPSFRNKIPDEQMWQIAGYVRSMGRYVPSDAAPSRDDRLHPRPAENRLPAGEPKSGNIPPSAEQP